MPGEGLENSTSLAFVFAIRKFGGCSRENSKEYKRSMSLKLMNERIRQLPELADWKQVLELFDPDKEFPSLDWTLPMLTCQAVSGEGEAGLVGGSALACMQISIILVDDILDEDPEGVHHQIGVGRAANIALALEAAAFRLLDVPEIPSETRSSVMSSLAWMGLSTAYGQQMDVENRGNEEDYWRVVRAKSTPFYGSALEIGAILGGADPATTRELKEVGLKLGEIVQLHDDLFDVFAVPPKPDWNRPENNLLLLYALTAEYAEKSEFQAMVREIDTEESRLKALQGVLIRSGAVSYCVYNLIERHRDAIERVMSLELVDPEAIINPIRDQTIPALKLLAEAGAELPEEYTLIEGDNG
jgi:geranylgeranyl pyrophosphate synthase